VQEKVSALSDTKNASEKARCYQKITKTPQLIFFCFKKFLDDAEIFG
jgi:hypothetical protein